VPSLIALFLFIHAIEGHHPKTYDTIIPTAQHRAISTLARTTNHIERCNNTLRQRVSRLWHVFPSALHVFRTIPTFYASMAQKTRDTCAIVF
jgi:transposase-like protein